MGFEFLLKTEFYETKIFDLRISKGRLPLFPAESGGQAITIQEKDIISHTPKEEKSLGLELRT